MTSSPSLTTAPSLFLGRAGLGGRFAARPQGALGTGGTINWGIFKRHFWGELLRHPHEEVDGVWEGHLLRWNKQMALRGRGRVFDEHGICGKQKLVFTGDYERLLLYKDRMFPGSKLTPFREETALSSWKTRRRQLVEILSSPKLTNVVTTNEIADLMQVKAWRDVS